VLKDSHGSTHDHESAILLESPRTHKVAPDISLFNIKDDGEDCVHHQDLKPKKASQNTENVSSQEDNNLQYPDKNQGTERA
jgi:hypothetical protein